MTRDIRGAKRNDWDNCPISRCIRRTFPCTNVEVYDEFICINGTEYGHSDDTLWYAEAWDLGSFRVATLELTPDLIAALQNKPNNQTKMTK